MHTAAAGSALGAFTVLGATAKGQGKTFRVALIGCGGRGRGALGQHLNAANILNKALSLGLDMKVVATGDYFKDRAEQAGKGRGVPENRCFGGADCYRKVFDSGKIDILVTAATPAFRPPHVEAAVEHGAHVFTEKPVAVDARGCRRIIQAGEKAKEKGLLVVAGTQRRHQKNYIDTQHAICVENVLGRVMGGRVSWCSGHMFARSPINAETTDDFVRSWKNWIELSGDHIVEQHVHNLDIGNWFMGGPPVAAVGFGGRAHRPAGNMFDYFSIDLEYSEGRHIHSMCRQVSGCWRWVGEELICENGTTRGSGAKGLAPKASPVITEIPQVRGGHQQEHVNMLYYLVKGKYINEARNVAEATAVAVMGRDACYTGQRITWQEMMDDPKKNPAIYNRQLKPTAEDFEKGSVEIPKEGDIPIPGKKV
jgi:predicted dehydrogenase